ncbi:hypothetical protein L6452_09545 [Arctium lappa]|uniref:Uncharacterized protein n=1 Tax=Arctium lappa TaxID=4217 RepID=A0ACB9DKZ6_ARCLA|nr:hypothetical protein L6452_09545 [Arctium lappa]
MESLVQVHYLSRLALEKMFSCFTIGQCGSQGAPGKESLSESKLRDLLHSSEYVLTYEDKDGDWMLVGDVPWDEKSAIFRLAAILISVELNWLRLQVWLPSCPGNYNSNLTQGYGEDATSHPIIDEELWQQAVGGSKKGRTYDIGNTKDPNLVLTGVPSGGYSSGASSSDIQALETRLLESEEARNKEMEEMRRRDEVSRKEHQEMMEMVRVGLLDRSFRLPHPQSLDG